MRATTFSGQANAFPVHCYTGCVSDISSEVILVDLPDYQWEAESSLQPAESIKHLGTAELKLLMKHEDSLCVSDETLEELRSIQSLEEWLDAEGLEMSGL